MNQESITSYWEQEVCGTRFTESADLATQSREITASRYQVEPFIPTFAKFDSRPTERVLEVGVGAGTDFMQWLRTGADCYGIDATRAAIDLTRSRIEVEGCSQPKSLQVADAAALPFDRDYFDLVYSYGVIHHAERTADCIKEIARVVRPGGEVRLMVYSSFSATGLMLWALYGAAKGHPFKSQKALVAEHLESPGTKSFTKAEARVMVEAGGLSVVSIEKKAGTGDLLQMPPSAKYQDQRGLYSKVQRFYPRTTVKRFEGLFGMALLIVARKAQ